MKGDVYKELILKKMDESQIKAFTKVWEDVLKHSHPAIIATPEERPTAQFIGNVWNREIDYGNSLETIAVVENDNRDLLTDLLEEQFMNKKVMITIQELKPEFEESCVSCKFFNPEINLCKERKTTVYPDNLKCYKWRYFA
jgi:hypothetical protein